MATHPNNGQYKKTSPKIKYLDRTNFITAEIFDDILIDVALGQSVKRSVEERGFNTHQFFRRIWENPDEATKYDRAKERSLIAMAAKLDDEADRCRLGEVRTTKKVRARNGKLVIAEETVQVVDNVARSRLSVATTQWQLARLARRKFGDQPTDSDDGKNDSGVLVIPGATSIAEWEKTANEQRERLAALAKELAAEEPSADNKDEAAA